MLNTNCTLCSTQLTDENKTKEHIIPNSIGGWDEVEDFICVSCNSATGDKWDAELAAQFNWIALMIGIIRDRNESPPKLVSTVSGEKFLLQNDGSMLPAKFKYQELKDGEQTKISFIARTPKEAKKKIEEIAKRFPQIDKDKLLENAKIKTSYLNEPLHIDMNFGGPLAGRSVVKTALAFAFSRGINPHSCENAKNFVCDETADSSCYGLMYLADVVKIRPANTLFHCIALFGDRGRNRLFAYVEYFGLARWLIELSKNYDGPELREVYAIDPSTALSVNIEVVWSLTDEMIEKTLNGYGYTDESYMAAITSSMDEVMRRNKERGLSNAVKSSFFAAGEKLGLVEGDTITPDISRKFSSTMVEELMPYILHQMGVRK
ncbi:HNH endonuclease [Massilia sp. Root351]|uniref:HNH endonuclease n=1 Tax=Massilia sp. Root351 TaxID=1736522 RepID=UPI00138EE1C3|nr:HNH endonuclease [Massilia sp. Root351]